MISYLFSPGLASKSCWEWATEDVTHRAKAMKMPMMDSRKVAKVDKCFRTDSDQEIGDYLHQRVG